MAETFYSVLGVEPGADGETVERAYRERVKETHPDVTDDPEAPREFARLTVARDVLVDDEERGRYDRLGHAAYVRTHVDASVWTADDAEEADAGSGGTDESAATAAGTGAGTENRSGTATSGNTGTTTSEAATSGQAETGTTPGASGAATGSGRRRRHQRGTAAAYHRVEPTDIGGREPDPLWRRVAAAGRHVGPWALVHLVLVASAAATAWFGYAGAAHLDMSLPALLVAAGVLVVTLLASAVHLLSLYA